MYQIDPNRAMTEMFGVGKGEAQVFDNTQAERGIQMGIKLREQRQQEEIAKAKANKAKYEEISKQAIGQVHPSDIGQFNKMMGGYRQEVYDAYLRGGGELSVDDQLKLQQKFGEINQLALNSKAKFDANKSLLANIENSKEPFRDRELAKAYEQASKPSFDEKTGQWNFDTVKGITPVYDLSKDIDTAAKERANWLEKNQEKYNRKSWTIEQSAADVENLFKSNAVARKELYEQMLDMNPDEFKDLVNNVYNSPRDDYGYKNTSYKGNVDVNKITPDNVNIDDVAKYMYTNRFYADAAGFAPTAYSPYGREKYESGLPRVAETFTSKTGGYLEAHQPKDITDRTAIKLPMDDGKQVSVYPGQATFEIIDGKKVITGGYAYEELTSEQKDDNDLIRKKNAENRQKRARMAPPERGTGFLGIGEESEKDYQKRLDEFNKEMDKRYPIQPLIEPKKVELTPQEAKDLTFLSTNVDYDAIAKGDTRGVKFRAGTPVKEDVGKVEIPYTNITTLKDKTGKSVKAGVKNGKWYNVETGAEIK